jgi:hypothetical protein
MTSEQATQSLWEQCRDTLRGWKAAILYFGKGAIEAAYRRGLEEGRRESSDSSKSK